MRRNEIILLAKKAADAWRNTDTYHQAAQIIDMLISELEGDPTLPRRTSRGSCEDRIKHLESAPPHHYGKRQRERAIELEKVKIKALRPVSRQQVEKVWKGEWVKRHKHRGGFRRVTGMDDMGEQHTITIDERCEYDDLYCSKCGKQSPDNFLNFCGYCGAPMTDEAVDMEIKRLEALYGKRCERRDNENLHPDRLGDADYGAYGRWAAVSCAI